LPQDAELKAEREPDLLGGVVVIKGTGEVTSDQDWTGKLYRTSTHPRRVALTAIPYYAWDNRKAGAMKAWIPIVPPPPVVGSLETQALVSISFQNSNCQPWGINDGVEPKNSFEQSKAQCHWWPHKGTQEWVQYTWEKPVTVSGSKVYWFDDTGRGACRLPASWEIQYREGEAWKPVHAKSEYAIAKDRWCEVSFVPVTTTALRLEVQLQKDWAAGAHEWKAVEADEE
jgi:hypothetical protein